VATVLTGGINDVISLHILPNLEDHISLALCQQMKLAYKVAEFYIRVEFQKRGTPHVHYLLANLVRTNQRHKCIADRCLKRTGTCKDRFPQPILSFFGFGIQILTFVLSHQMT